MDYSPEESVYKFVSKIISNFNFSVWMYILIVKISICACFFCSIAYIFSSPNHLGDCQFKKTEQWEIAPNTRFQFFLHSWCGGPIEEGREWQGGYRQTGYKLYIESDREVADVISAPIDHSWSDCTGRVSRQYNQGKMVVLAQPPGCAF